MKPRILIATPVHKTIESPRTVTALMDTGVDLTNRGIPFRYVTIEGSDIAEQRDILARSLLSSDATHIFCVDADMVPGADLCARLLSHNKEFVAAICARRELDLSKLKALIEAGRSFDDALALAYHYNFNALPDQKIPTSGAIFPVAHIGTGAILISRMVFERLSDSGEVGTYRSIAWNMQLVGFHQRLNDEEGRLLSEDFSLCHRWRAVGGDVWADPLPNVKHVGSFDYGVAYIKAIHALAR